MRPFRNHSSTPFQNHRKDVLEKRNSGIQRLGLSFPYVLYKVLESLIIYTPLILPAIPPEQSDDMGKPLVPDFSDDEKVKQYIHDRRVIGVHIVACSPPDSYRTDRAQYDPLLAPSFLLHKLPTSPESLRTTALARYRASQIIQGQSSDLLVIVGPCSIHSPAQALHYARLLKTQLDAGRCPPFRWPLNSTLSVHFCRTLPPPPDPHAHLFRKATDNNWVERAHQ